MCYQCRQFTASLLDKNRKYDKGRNVVMEPNCDDGRESEWTDIEWDYEGELHRARPDGTCECRRRVTCPMDDSRGVSLRHRMSPETVIGSCSPARPGAVCGGRVEGSSG
ncbi:hypothetical protein EVAR_85634_1 [Eumeta japonica]|uniref:Uncharacterized protein n=1 Tax=Eumeta variegata TaxID=151549 RepID=A0A4C1XW87_EUMVA|nr:hypothetical protein EVAR_85634_1 [Eumeta japonica]